MKRKTTVMIKGWITLLLCAACSLLVHDPLEASCCYRQTTRVFFAPEWQYHTDKFDGFNRYKGSLWGFRAGLDFRPPCCVYAGLRGNWDDGTIRAWAINQAGQNVRRKEQIQTWDVEARIGWTVPLWRSVYVTYFSGFGYDYYRNDVSQTIGQTLQALVYTNYYVPFGVMVEWVCCSWLSLGLNAKLEVQVDPRGTVQDISGLYFKVHKKVPWDVEVPITLRLFRICGGVFDTAVIPWFSQDDFGRSSVATFALPGGNRWSVGVRVELGYGF